MIKRTLFLFLVCVVQVIAATAQCGYLWNISKQSEIPFDFPYQAMATALHTSNTSVLYIAAKERGLQVYDISTSPAVLKDSIPVAALGNMEVMNLQQDGNYLYLALGNVFNNNSLPGMAIIDVSNATQPVLKDVWAYNTASGGAGIVKIAGSYAYLGAMRQGLIVLDITDKNNIQFASQLIPSISYPNPINPDPLKYNARGMEIAGDKVYLCYDAGGLCIIDVSNKQNPVEIGKYSNPALLNRPRAYNNIVLDGTTAYVATDYCGMEILNIDTPSNIKPIGWWNPWQCDNGSVNNWFNSPGYTNEIRLYKECRLVFMSSGRNELQIVNVTNPANPVLCDSFGNGANTEGTWGVSLYDHKIFLSYIFVPWGIPFYSNWGGIKILDWNVQCEGGIKDTEAEHIQCYPNPARDELVIEGKNIAPASIVIHNVMGRQVLLPATTWQDKIIFNTGNLPGGVYFLQYHNTTYRFVKQ